MTEKLLWVASPVHAWWTHGLGSSITSWGHGEQAGPCASQAAAFLGVNASYGQKLNLSSCL